MRNEVKQSLPPAARLGWTMLFLGNAMALAGYSLKYPEGYDSAVTVAERLIFGGLVEGMLGAALFVPLALWTVVRVARRRWQCSTPQPLPARGWPELPPRPVVSGELITQPEALRG
jgi:hypothetical protein